MNVRLEEPGPIMLRRKKVLYYLDEASILLLGVVAVMFSRAFRMALHGRHPEWTDVWTGSLQMILGVFSTVAFYGLVHTRWKYSADRKPDWWKRAAVVVFQGMNWRAMWEG